MKFSTPQKRYIVFEGLDGSGTTTQWKLLQNWLTETGQNFIAVREPSPGLIGQLIRKFLSGDIPTDQGVLARLFAADRRQQMFEIGGIADHLQRQNWVVSDRCLVSSLAYQSMELNFKSLIRLNEGIHLPGLIFFVDVSPDLGLERVLHRKDKLEIFENEEAQKRVRKNYGRALRWIRNLGTKVITLSGAASVDSIHDAVKANLIKYMNKNIVENR